MKYPGRKALASSRCWPALRLTWPLRLLPALPIVLFLTLPAVMLTACSGPIPTPSPTSTPTPTSTPAPTPTATPAVLSFTVDRETTWGDALDAFTPAERDCIRSAVDDGTLRRALGERLLSDGYAEDWEKSIFLCVAPQSARALFLSIRIAEVEAEGVDLSSEEEACLRDWVAGLEIGVLVADGDDPAVGLAFSGMIACIPDIFVDIIVEAVQGEIGVELEPTAAQRGCLRDWMTSMGAAAFGEDLAGDIPIGLFACMPDVFVDVVLQAWLDEGTMSAIGEEERACVQGSLESLLELTPESLDDADAESLFTLITLNMLSCLPDLLMEWDTPQHSAVLWQYDTNAEPYAPEVRDAVLYTSAGNHVHAVDVTTGEQLWRYGEEYDTHSQPTERDGVVYVGTFKSDGAFLVALDGTDGRVLWRVPTGSPVELQPVVSRGRVVAGSYTGPIFAVDAETGASAWESTTYMPTWDSPIADDGIVYALAGAAAAYALDAVTGEVRWEYVTNGTPTTMTLADGVLYFAGDLVREGAAGDASVEAVDAASGVLLWEFLLHEVIPEIAVAGGLMYVKDYGDNLVAMNAQTGAEVWRFAETLSSAPVISDGVVYVAGFDGSVYALDAASGKLLWELHSVASGYVSSLTVADDVVYAAAWNRLYAIDTRAEASGP